MKNEIRELQSLPSEDSKSHEFNQTIKSDRSTEQRDSTRNRVERELYLLRQQLSTFNEEENKVLQELQETKTLRKAFEEGVQDQYSAMSDSFNIVPQRLNFDNVSQKSFGLHSPGRTSNCAFKKF